MKRRETSPGRFVRLAIPWIPGAIDPAQVRGAAAASQVPGVRTQLAKNLQNSAILAWDVVTIGLTKPLLFQAAIHFLNE
jgi:hypothetical protein